MSKNELQSASSLESSKKEQLSDEITQLKTASDSNRNDVKSRVKLAVVLTEQGENQFHPNYS